MRALVLPRPELAPFVCNIMAGGFPALDVHLPASSNPRLVIYLRGGAVLQGDKGATLALPPAFVSGPVLAAQRFRVAPGSCFVAVTFRPSGFLRCLGIPVDLLAGAPVPLDALLPPGVLGPLLDAVHRANGVPALVQALEDFLVGQLRSLTRAPAPLPAFTNTRLLQSAAGLADELGLSTRQFERRFLAHHGMPLRDYRRVARFKLALAMLMQPAGRQYGLAAAAHEAGYVDQPHFNRDFSQFIGDTPSHFLKARLAEGSQYRFWQFGADELRSFMA